MSELDALRMMRWEPKYHGFRPNPKAPGGGVDMWLLVDDETGEGIVSVGVPKGRSDIAGYIAACCSNPVRWVTSMVDHRDLRRDGVDDPEGVLERETKEIADVLFRTYTGLLEERGRPQANAWTLNDALSRLWFAFCGQLPHDMRGHLIFRFLELATTDYRPPAPEEAASAAREKDG